MDMFECGCITVAGGAYMHTCVDILECTETYSDNACTARPHTLYLYTYMMYTKEANGSVKNKSKFSVV